jgi:predicted DNA binding CopG/RHH family protein
MTLLDFANKYCRLNSLRRNETNNHLEIDPPKPVLNYTKKMLGEFEKYQYLAYLNAVNIEVEFSIECYIAYFLLFNKEKKNTILSYTSDISNKKRIINGVKLKINYFLEKNNDFNIKIISNNTNDLILNNGNIFTFINKNSENVSEVIFNYASYIDDFESIFKITKKWAPKIMIFSTISKKPNYYYDEIIKNDDNFTKIKLNWQVNDIFTEYYGQIIKEQYGEENFKREYELITPDYKNLDPKSKLISLRLSENQLNKIIHKLVDKNISISEYLRELVDFDIKR